MKRALSIVAAVLFVMTVAVAPVTAATDVSRAYLIGSRRPLTATQVTALRSAGATVRYVYRNFGGAAAMIPDSRVARVRSLSFVTSLGRDRLRQLASVEVAAPSAVATPAAPTALPGTPYWLDLMNAETNTTYDGSGVWVAVLDSGFFPNWRDYFDPATILTDKARAFISARGTPNPNQWDVGSDPHGMAVAAEIVGFKFVDDRNEGGWGGDAYVTGAAGTYWVPGIAPGAKVIPVKVCEPIGCWESAINAGIDYVTSLKKANPSQPIVINESLGGPGLGATEKAAIDAAIKAGVVIVASAGNEGNAGMGFPANYEPVISVGAGGWTQQWVHNGAYGKLWWLDDVPETGVDEVYIVGFSSRQLAGQHLDVVGPGRFLLLPYPCAQLYKDGLIGASTNVRTCASKATPDNAHASPFQYLFISGTSMSSPAVAGVVALMLDKNPSLSNADAATGTLGDPSSWGQGSLETLLENSATDIPPGQVTITYRTGDPVTECWEMGTTGCTLEATGHGWVFVDDALSAVP